MKDIDFDELDRAVSSLMKTVPEGTTPAAPTDTTRIVNLDDTGPVSTATLSRPLDNEVIPEVPVPPLSSSEEAEVLSSEVVVEQAAEQSSSVPAPVVPRGRFMDVVRPSGRDVRKPFASGAISRQGVTVEPTKTVQSSKDDPGESHVDEAPATTDQTETDTFTDTYEAFSKNLMEDTAEETMPLSEVSFGDAETAEDTVPLGSPFLPDAKVEKRPLGRPAEIAPTVDLAAELAEEKTETAPVSLDAPDETIAPDNDAQLPEQPLPAELGSELLSIETSTDSLPDESRTPIHPEPTTPAQDREDRPAGGAPSTVARAMAATSIPQQYKVQSDQTEVEPTGAIYDTQPLAHPAKGKPGWLWVVAIIVILLLGAGSGAAVYYLGLL